MFYSDRYIYIFLKSLLGSAWEPLSQVGVHGMYQLSHFIFLQPLNICMIFYSHTFSHLSVM